MIAALTIGHAGKPDHPFDRGCAYKHPSGVRLAEVPLVRAYANAIDEELLRHGSVAVLLSDGSYDDRARRAIAMGADCLLALHANAGLAGRPGQRGEIYYWPGNVKGERLATALAHDLEAVTPYPFRVVAAEQGPYLSGARVQAVRSTIDGAAYPSVCVEPFFVDAADADTLITPAFLAQIGSALATGLLRWRATRGG